MPAGSILKFRGALVAALCLCSVHSAQAQDLKQIQAQEAVSTEKAAARQQRIDSADDEAHKMASDFRRVSRKIDRQEKHKSQIEKLLADQASELISLNDQIARVPAIEQQAFPLMKQMVESLDAFIRADLPFSLKPRLTNVMELKALLDRADATPSEKMRKIFKSYAQEMDYGRGIEAYDGEYFDDPKLVAQAIEKNYKMEQERIERERKEAVAKLSAQRLAEAGEISQESTPATEIMDAPTPAEEPAEADHAVADEETKRLVTFLRYGRVGFVYQSFDGAETGLWDQKAKRWRPITGPLAKEIKTDIAIAYKRIPPDMMVVPVIQEAK